MSILESRDLHWPDEAACAASAAELARQPEVRSALIELHGPLGAGKTTFVRHLLRALGVEGPIKSPTYALMEPYSAVDAAADTAPKPAVDAASDAKPDASDAAGIWHFDFYRFDDPQEWQDAGFRDVFASPGLKLVEWPEKAAGLLPEADLVITIGADDREHREVRYAAQTPLGARLLP